jgi:TonB family protein
MKVQALAIFLLITNYNCFASSEIASKFGIFKVVDSSKIEFNNQLLKLEGDEIREIDIVKIFNFTDYDILLIRKKGNESCLIDFNLIVVSELGANVTESFGTCIDLSEAHQNEDSVVITMPMKAEGQFKKVTYTNDFPTKPPKKTIESSDTALASNYTSSNPRRKFIGARTKDYHLAIYLEKWRQLLESKFSNAETLKPLSKIGAYGAVQLMVSIKPDGSIYNIETSKSSGNSQLDNAVINLVEQSGPFEKFPEEILRDTDILSIVRTFSFTHE